jgi:endonuclease/exonuclease/phosphatase family metal-dependent hydrolase
MSPGIPVRLGILLFTVALLQSVSAGTFRVATYNVESYLDQPTQSRPQLKSAEARAKIRETIRAADPDVIALEEMGSTNALLELRASLQTDGLNFPYWEHIQGFDTNIHVAVLSKLPIVERHPHTNDYFLLDDRRFRVSRGFAELQIAAATNFTFTLIAAHLKSRLAVPDADEAEERLGEARVLRNLIDARLAREPAAPLIVLGDFNDTPDSTSTREIIGRGRTRLIDTRPAERNGDSTAPLPPYNTPRNVTWTYYYGKADEYSRIDYILVSPALGKHWLSRETYIPAVTNWGIGSDHRLIVAEFSTE